MNTSNTAHSVSSTIYNQIGDRAFTMMGAQNFLFGTDSEGDYLQFRVRGSRKGNLIKVNLTPADLYLVRMFKIRGLDFREVECSDNVYPEGLASTISALTGLDVRL